MSGAHAGARRLHALLRMIDLLVFDADDTLRYTMVPGQPTPHAPHEWALLPGVRETLSEIDWSVLPVRVGVASNQDHVAYGHLTYELAAAMLRDTVIAATDRAVREPFVALCPHALDARCGCRKPEPGMLIDLMLRAKARPSATVFVGNAECDRQAAARAGVLFVWAGEVFGVRG